MYANKPIEYFDFLDENGNKTGETSLEVIIRETKE